MHNELTKKDIQMMKEELDYRRIQLRPQLLEAVKEARAFGDLSENFEYKAAKQEKNRNEIHIRDLKRARRHVALVDLIAILTHHDLRVSSRNTAHHRRIAFQGIRQHIVVGRQLDAAKRHAVKDIGRRGTVSERKLGLQGNSRALHQGVDVVPLILAGRIAGPGGVVA